MLILGDILVEYCNGIPECLTTVFYELLLHKPWPSVKLSCLKECFQFQGLNIGITTLREVGHLKMNHF